MEAEVVINKLIQLYHEKRIAHAYLIETNNMLKCYEDIKMLIKAICCPGEYNANCNKCNLCHLINENNLPSFVVIEPDGKQIKKDAIENLKNSFSTIPLYTDNNIYVIKYPEKMNDTAFNKMLKFLEEPENNIIGFFITENKDYVASTIVSRCEVLKIMYQSHNDSEILGISEEEYEKYNSLSKKYIQILENGSPKDIVWYNNSILTRELTERIEIINFLRTVFQNYINEVNQKKDIIKNSQILNILEKYLEQLNYNVNTTLLLDSLAIELGELYGK